MTPRENAMAIFNHEQPDYYFDFMNSMQIVPDPVLMQDVVPQDGKLHQDSWGTWFVYRPEEPGEQPVVNDENAVIKDIEKWEDQVKVPDLDHLDWSMGQQIKSTVDRKEKFVGIFCPGGLFERSHHLMGFENTLINFMEYPDEMAALLRVIADYKKKYIRLAAEKLHPDVIFYQDDWGSKQNVFLPPDLWRKIIKPLQIEIADTIHECGMMYVHHADCVCEPIVQDMVDIGIDIWQGVIPQNDIVRIQQITDGKLPMIGGIDGPKIDVDGISEEAIRAEVRRCIDTYCPGGRFYPGITYGVLFHEWNNSIAQDELAKYGKQFAEEHPISSV